MTSLQSIPNKTFKNPKKHVSEIVSLVTKEMKKYPTPSVTMVSLQKDPYKVLISCLLSLRTRDLTTIEASKRLFPKEFWWEYNNTFVGFGQNGCKPVTPRCGKCWIAGYCRFFHKKVMPSLLKKEKNFEKKVWVLKEGIQQI